MIGYITPSLWIIVSYDANRGCWRADTSDANQWIGVEFDFFFEIKAIQIQSRHDRDYWVETFELTYSMDGENWITYSNGDGETVMLKFDMFILITGDFNENKCLSISMKKFNF